MLQWEYCTLPIVSLPGIVLDIEFWLGINGNEDTAAICVCRSLLHGGGKEKGGAAEFSPLQQA